MLYLYYCYMDSPSNWECVVSGHLNADGASIEFEHTTKDLRAVIEATSELPGDYFTVIFDTNTSNPTETVEPHEMYGNEQEAREEFLKLLQKHN